MLDDHAVEYGLDRLSILGRELSNDFELQLEFVVGPAIIGIEHEVIVIVP